MRGSCVHTTAPPDQEVLALGSADMYCVAHGNGLYLYAGDTKVYTSTDGTNWINSANPANITFNDILFHNDLFYLVGWDGNTAGACIMSTMDGTHLSGNLPPADADSTNCIAHGDGIFVAGANSGKIWVSASGISWSRLQPAAANIFDIQVMAYGVGRFVAATNEPSIIYSDDGVTWAPAVAASGGFPSLATITVRP
ncbi:MAG: hypothetical protein JXA20_17830 [Spirochaetes bacterium]|nr:hypothetical protein [Spirochaetota bacterium]